MYSITKCSCTHINIGDSVLIGSIDLPTFFYLGLLCQLRLYPCVDKEHALIKHIFAEGTWKGNYHGIELLNFLMESSINKINLRCLYLMMIGKEESES